MIELYLRRYLHKNVFSDLAHLPGNSTHQFSVVHHQSSLLTHNSAHSIKVLAPTQYNQTALSTYHCPPSKNNKS